MADILRTTLATIAAAVVRPYPDVVPFVKAMTNVCQIFTGSVTGTSGVALPVAVPGLPRACFALNRTDPTFAFKVDTMTGLYGMKLIDTGPALTYDNNLISFASNILTFGTDTDLNQNSQVIEYIVWI